MRIAVCPGSFDPVTKGHLDIVTRASKLFDRVIVLVVINAAKTPSFTPEERVRMIREVIGDSLPNVEVDTFSGLLADYVRDAGAVAIVKGLRAVSDFEYEFQMALANKKLNPLADTVYAHALHIFKYLHISKCLLYVIIVSNLLAKIIYYPKWLCIQFITIHIGWKPA